MLRAFQALAVLHALSSFALTSATEQNPQSKPNFVFVLTDDQDVHLNSMDYMPLTRKHLAEKGTTFERHYCTIAVCCPARVALWTGKYAHNTNVTNVSPPWGGYPKFISEGLNENYLPVWMQAAGYNTYYTGKLFNDHNTTNWNTPYPAGFTQNNFLLDPLTYSFYDSVYQKDKDAPAQWNGSYSTDVLTESTLGFIDHSIAEERPFFVVAAPVAPHSAHTGDFENGSTAPIPAKRHEGLFGNETVPRNPGFNPDEPSGASWVRNLTKINDTSVAFLDEWQRQRIRSLQSVDEMVESIVKKLEETGTLDNTYIIYSSDNGFHIGQHRMQAGKGCPYEEDVNVPLIIRGPGIKENARSDIVTSHQDLAPTIMALAGEAQRPDFDGSPIPVKECDQSDRNDRQEHVGIEFWGYNGLGEGLVGVTPHINTYKALRVISKKYNLYYSVWCDGDREMYDMTTDQYQHDNLLLGNQTIALLGRPLPNVADRLDALLLVQKSCKAEACRDPWKQLHPDGHVQSLADALHPRFDEFYNDQIKVEYDACQPGYIVGSEGPQFEIDGHQFGASWE